MIISVINLSNGLVKDATLQHAIRAVNRQIAEDFQPYWGFGARLRLEGKSGLGRASVEAADMRGDAVLYVRVTPKKTDVDGFHSQNFAGIPYGFVYLDVSKKLKEDWTVTLSHEALELLADPELNLLVQGPHPKEPDRQVFHWFEMCDAVQNETYVVDGVRVSNFVLPLYFTSSDERGGRNDFLGTVNRGKTLQSFGVNPGGYINFFDPTIADDATVEGDRRGGRRLAIKRELGIGRGQLRGRRRLSTT